MRHLKNTCKLNRTSSHRRCMFANMLKSLIEFGRIETTVPKAKALRRYADRLITLAKKGTLAALRDARAQLMVRYNTLTPKEARAAKNGDTSSYNTDRTVMDKLVVHAKRFESRQGGYTRINKLPIQRKGDNAELCVIEYLPE